MRRCHISGCGNQEQYKIQHIGLNSNYEEQIVTDWYCKYHVPKVRNPQTGLTHIHPSASDIDPS